jgi:glycosyltransferase involved in cell wall biosynthesis
MKARVVFLIRRLDRGGAERQLIDLAVGLSKDKFHVTIVTFYKGGRLEPEIRSDSGVDVVNLDKRGSCDVLFLGRLIRTIQRLQPDIVHGYMTGANELSVIAGRACGARVVWGLRASEAAVPQAVSMRGIFHAGAVLSRLADCIIANSEYGRSFHVAKGYCDQRMTVIPNGIDTERFTILPGERQAVRREWMVRDDEILIARAARLDPVKDYPLFLRAAAQVSRALGNVKVACVGDGTGAAALNRIATAEGIANRMVWTGGRADMRSVYNAVDICVSSSSSEGFPNAVAEPMACGTPCVATDVGDSARLIGDVGIIVPPGDADAMAQGIRRLITDRLQYPRERVRKRITENFSLELLVARTEAEFAKLLTAPRASFSQAPAKP